MNKMRRFMYDYAIAYDFKCTWIDFFWDSNMEMPFTVFDAGFDAEDWRSYYQGFPYEHRMMLIEVKSKDYYRYLIKKV